MLFPIMIVSACKGIAVMSVVKGINDEIRRIENETEKENSAAVSLNRIFFCRTAEAAESSAEQVANVNQNIELILNVSA